MKPLPQQKHKTKMGNKTHRKQLTQQQQKAHKKTNNIKNNISRNNKPQKKQH